MQLIGLYAAGQSGGEKQQYCLCDKKVQKGKFHKNVRPAMMYGSECRVINKKAKKKRIYFSSLREQYQ